MLKLLNNLSFLLDTLKQEFSIVTTCPATGCTVIKSLLSSAVIGESNIVLFVKKIYFCVYTENYVMLVPLLQMSSLYYFIIIYF